MAGISLGCGLHQTLVLSQGVDRFFAASLSSLLQSGGDKLGETIDKLATHGSGSPGGGGGTRRFFSQTTPGDLSCLQQVKERVTEKADLWVEPDGTLTEAVQNCFGFIEKEPEGNGQGFSVLNLLRIRTRALLAVGRFGLREQAAFFQGGELKPILQQACAEAIGMSDTTVCSAIKGKTILVGGEKYDLRFFFTQYKAAHPYEIQKWIKAKVQAEPSDAPLSDKDLRQLWNQERGGNIPLDMMQRWRREAGVPSSRHRCAIVR
jgi:hypothetical protein